MNSIRRYLIGEKDAASIENNTERSRIQDDNTTLTVHGYRESSLLIRCVYFFLHICTCGILALVFHWRPDLYVYCTHKSCNLREATKLLIIEVFKTHKSCYLHSVFSHTLLDELSKHNTESSLISCNSIRLNYKTALNDLNWTNLVSIRYATHKSVKLVYSEKYGEFQFINHWSFMFNRDFNFYHNLYQPMSEKLAINLRAIFGLNTTYIHITPICSILAVELLSKFYVFQIFACIVWYIDEYEYYATAIVIVSALSLTTTIYQQRQNERQLRFRMMSPTNHMSVLSHGGKFTPIRSENLVPGHVILFPIGQQFTVPCDIIVLSGNVLVDEGMLTGECTPVTKTSLPTSDQEIYSATSHACHTLFAGTRVLQTRQVGDHMQVVGLVIRTGFNTTKGRIIRSVMYPSPSDYQFEYDIAKFLTVMAFTALIGVTYSSITKYSRGLELVELLLDVIDLITIVVSPALPYAMVVGCLIALNRLKCDHDVLCIAPRNINMSALINYACFDKTGTLTEQGTDLVTALHVLSAHWLSDSDVLNTDWTSRAMACCHSLTLLSENLVGDPIDLKMFEASGWKFDNKSCDPVDGATVDGCKNSYITVVSCQSAAGVTEAKQPPIKIGILRLFTFDSSLRRMSVLTRQLGDTSVVAYCKGAPETIVDICEPDSVPANITQLLEKYFSSGYRVIATAHKQMGEIAASQLSHLERRHVECHMLFSGLLVFENRVKPALRHVINSLQQANIKCVIISGDNVLTSECVARECGIIPAGTPSVIHCKVEADLYRHSHSPLMFCGEDVDMFCESERAIETMIERGVVFARMLPNHKQKFIELVKSRNRYVSMCGDAANDCGALKSAHLGLCVSNTEASLAAAFTSRSESLASFIEIIRESRVALVTSFAVLQYMITYSFTQFISVMLLYETDNSLTDFQFLFIDLCLITVFAGLFGLTRARLGTISRLAPSHTLLTASVLCSLVTQIVLVGITQYLSLWWMRRQVWMVPRIHDDEESYYSDENYAVYTVSSVQYIVLVLVYNCSVGTRVTYRRPLYTNVPLSASCVLAAAVCVWNTLYGDQWLSRLLGLKVPSDTWYKFTLLMGIVTYSIVALLIQILLINVILSRWRGSGLKKQVQKKNTIMEEKNLIV